VLHLAHADALAHYLTRHGPGCVLVPTMGALHAGHAALIRHAANLARDTAAPGGCVVTIFVNPTQFNDPADLARYPRTLDADLQLCEHAGAAAAFSPSVDEVYPRGTAANPPASLPQAATTPGLEDAHRPGHFAGVVQVVARLFELTRPAQAVFGEKDWQQLRVIDQMSARLPSRVRIVPSPTVREPSGLAMSSRNVFLSPPQREQAQALSRALSAAAQQPTVARAEATLRDTLAHAAITPEYAVVRDAATLLPLPPQTPRGSVPARALIAARVGAVRLIDNAPWA
jgi:pantoate--beta-alanine ligase